jgi:hypothetical protein
MKLFETIYHLGVSDKIDADKFQRRISNGTIIDFCSKTNREGGKSFLVITDAPLTEVSQSLIDSKEIIFWTSLDMQSNEITWGVSKEKDKRLSDLSELEVRIFAKCMHKNHSLVMNMEKEQEISKKTKIKH